MSASSTRMPPSSGPRWSHLSKRDLAAANAVCPSPTNRPPRKSPRRWPQPASTCRRRWSGVWASAGRYLDAAAPCGVVRAPSLVMLGDQVCRRLYYAPAGIVLGRGDWFEYVEWMMVQLEQTRATEQSARSMSRRLAEQ